MLKTNGMSGSNRTPESEGIEVVVVGSFNPAIFHPEWFLRQKLINEEDAKEAEATLHAVTSELAEVQICGINLLCISERFALGSKNISKAAQIQDLLIQIFTLLSHVPITACGINASAHYQLNNRELWHEIGHTLVPKQLIWNDLMESPGMASLTVKGVRKGEFPGEVNVTVEPSKVCQPGIYVRSNYHFPLPELSLHSGSNEILIKFVKLEWEKALHLHRQTADKIFEKIR